MRFPIQKVKFAFLTCFPVFRFFFDLRLTILGILSRWPQNQIIAANITHDHIPIYPVYNSRFPCVPAKGCTSVCSRLSARRRERLPEGTQWGWGIDWSGLTGICNQIDRFTPRLSDMIGTIYLLKYLWSIKLVFVNPNPGRNATWIWPVESSLFLTLTALPYKKTMYYLGLCESTSGSLCARFVCCSSKGSLEEVQECFVWWTYILYGEPIAVLPNPRRSFFKAIT